MPSTVGVVVFPGSNCESDVVEALLVTGADSRLLWHTDTDLSGIDAIIIPGGFAHGDYLRPGAIARFSPVMGAIGEFALSGGVVVGICNGFQVLTEAGLLAGALQKNSGLKFLCGPALVRVESTDSALTRNAHVGQVLNIPINHFEGNYICPPETRAQLEGEGRVILRYENNPNGSTGDIAGICNEARNVIGLMPHPERASHALLGSTDGLVLLSGLAAASRPVGVG